MKLPYDTKTAKERLSKSKPLTRALDQKKNISLAHKRAKKEGIYSDKI